MPFEPFRCLSTPPRKRHAMRSTDVCHSNDFRAPVLARSQLTPRLSSWGFPRRLGVSRFYRGRERFTTFLLRFGESSSGTQPRVSSSRQRAWAFSVPRCMTRSTSDVPVAASLRPRVDRPSSMAPHFEFVRLGSGRSGQDRRRHGLVKGRGLRRSGTPSIAKDPS